MHLKLKRSESLSKESRVHTFCTTRCIAQQWMVICLRCWNAEKNQPYSLLRVVCEYIWLCCAMRRRAHMKASIEKTSRRARASCVRQCMRAAKPVHMHIWWGPACVCVYVCVIWLARTHKEYIIYSYSSSQRLSVKIGYLSVHILRRSTSLSPASWRANSRQTSRALKTHTQTHTHIRGRAFIHKIKSRISRARTSTGVVQQIIFSYKRNHTYTCVDVANNNNNHNNNNNQQQKQQHHHSLAKHYRFVDMNRWRSRRRAFCIHMA